MINNKYILRLCYRYQGSNSKTERFEYEIYPEFFTELPSKEYLKEIMPNIKVHPTLKGWILIELEICKFWCSLDDGISTSVLQRYTIKELYNFKRYKLRFLSTRLPFELSKISDTIVYSFSCAVPHELAYEIYNKLVQKSTIGEVTSQGNTTVGHLVEIYSNDNHEHKFYKEEHEEYININKLLRDIVFWTLYRIELLGIDRHTDNEVVLEMVDVSGNYN